MGQKPADFHNRRPSNPFRTKPLWEYDLRVVGSCWLQSEKNGHCGSEPGENLEEFYSDASFLTVYKNAGSYGMWVAAILPPTQHKPCLSVRRRRLRICIYARYSTDEQDESSITDQIAYCKKYLESIGIDLCDVTIVEIADEGISGELVSRPGIDRVWEGIRAKRWDILIAEDCGRIYRNAPACVEIVDTAFDEGMRFIGINDDVDTDVEGWDDRLWEAAHHHSRSNRYTSFRIKRKLEGLWKIGAAIGRLRTGYRRNRPQDEVYQEGRRLRRKPKFDEIDQDWERIIRKAFEMVAAGEHLGLVAAWLTEMKLPKSSSKNTKWEARDVIRLIRRTIYRGHEIYRHIVSKRKRRTGKAIRRRNDPAFVLTREMPHLRIVTDSLWYAANKVIDNCRVNNGMASGEDHPLTDIGRETRFPLSTIFVCGIPDGDGKYHKMWADGRNEGGYRCSRAARGTECTCYNKATCVREFTHISISQVVTTELLALKGTADVLVQYIAERVRNNQPRRKEEERLVTRERTLARQQTRWEAAIECDSSDTPLDILVVNLRKCIDDLAEVRADLEQLRENTIAPPKVMITDIVTRIEKFAGQLLDMDRSAGLLLGRLIQGKILALPYQQFDSNNVVLRAHFTFRPMGILPDQLLAALNGAELEQVLELLPSKEITVDLFKPSLAPKHALAAVKLKETEPALTLQQLAERLHISKRCAHLALQLGIKMRAAGIEDPYIPLTKEMASQIRGRGPVRGSIRRPRKSA